MKPAIVETLMSQFVTEGRELLADVVTSEADAAWRRVLLGRFLLNVRSKLPRRGSPTYGWGAFLEAIEVDDMTAGRYIKLAEASLNLTERDKAKIPTYADLGLDKREGAQPPTDLPPPSDNDEPHEAIRERQLEVGGPREAAPTIEIDRNTWCTPKEWAEHLGSFDLDPCSNERSHIQAAREFRLDERAEDGLFFASKIDAKTRTFINPPYARKQVIQWVQAYAHTRFCFLLKFDPSTGWFDELMKHTDCVMFPRQTRIEFEPPPGVPPEEALANQFPHAFFYAHRTDVSEAIKKHCYPMWRIQ